MNWRDWEGGLALICLSGLSGRGALRTGVVRWVRVGWRGVVDWRWGGIKGVEIAVMRERSQGWLVILVRNIHIEGMGTVNDVCLDTSIYLHI